VSQRSETIELLGTEGCHLCEQAQWLLLPLCDELNLHIAVIDIAIGVNSDALITQYGERLPVLRQGKRELNWPFTVEHVRSWLKG
jgi:hypothetical protein